MLLQILGTLEGFAAEVALVWLQRNMHTNVRGDVVTLHSGCPAGVPLASQVQVVGALSADMTLADMILRCCISQLSLKSEQHQPRALVPESTSSSHMKSTCWDLVIE